MKLFSFSKETTLQTRFRQTNKVANVAVIDLENFIFSTLKPIWEIKEIDFKTANKAISELTNTSGLTENPILKEIGQKIILDYIETISNSLLDLLGAIGKELKMLSGYGFISLAIFIAKEPNKPILEEVRKSLMEKLRKINRNVLVIFLYGSKQKENDDYVLEGVIDSLKQGEVAYLLNKYLNYEKLTDMLKKEWEKLLNNPLRIFVVTKDRRLKNRLRQKFSTLIFGEADLDSELLHLLAQLKKVSKLTVIRLD